MIDVIGVVTSLYSLSVSVLKWIDETDEKNEALSDLSSTVKRIRDILERFQNVKNVEPALLNAFLGLGDMLSRTQEHLTVYSNNRKKLSFNKAMAFLAPAQVTKRLVQDGQQLANQLVLILFTMSSLSFIKGDTQASMTGELEKSNDIEVFWGDFVGAKISFARTERFTESLALCFGRKLSEEDRSRLILYLDEFRIGGVSRCSLETFVGEKSLKEAIERFVGPSEVAVVNDPAPIKKKKKRVYEEDHDVEEQPKRKSKKRVYEEDRDLQEQPKRKSTPTQLRLLVWIDDDLDNVDKGITFAESLNVKVVHLTSTALAKVWIEENEELLRTADRSGTVRFISDNVRFESPDLSSDAFLNIAAGENLLRYLRGRSFGAPVLIYCGSSIIQTEYVDNYEAAGSTCYISVVHSFISGLVEEKGEEEWRGYDREL